MNTQLSMEKDSIVGQLDSQLKLSDSLTTQVTDAQKIIQSDPFFLLSGEKKTIPIIMPGHSSDFVIPSWIKTNAGWWADGEIDDSSFVGGIQFLIQEGILILP